MCLGVLTPSAVPNGLAAAWLIYFGRRGCGGCELGEVKGKERNMIQQMGNLNIVFGGIETCSNMFEHVCRVGLR